MIDSLTTALAILDLAVAISFIVLACRRRSTLLPLLMASSLLAAFAEATVGDLAGFQDHEPSQGALRVYSAFGHHVGLWVFLAWGLWGAVIGYAAVTAAERRWPARKIWGLFVLFAVLDWPGEAFFSHIGAVVYHGAQPASPLGIPFVWPLVYSAAFLTAGLVLRWLTQQFTGYHRLLFLPLVGSTIAGLCAFAAWPTILARGIEAAPPLANLLGLVSAVLVITTLDTVIRLQHPHPPAQVVTTHKKTRHSGGHPSG
ncbi:hypothetical protein [Streptomyces achromogenes]|uniref:hypothetical protein n=1 Tax=Streptomyces achromogenes TaxID=67255 RepID=UPI0036A1F6A1